MEKKLRLIAFATCLILMINFSLAIEYADCSIYGTCKKPTTSITSFLNTTPVNSSTFADIWTTTEGNLDDVSDILHNWLSNLAWSVAGHTIDTNVDMDDNTIQNVGQLQTSAIGVILNAYADDLIIADHLRPFTTDDYNIGSNSYRWNDLFLSGNISSEGNTHRFDAASGNQTLTLDSGGIAYSCLELLEAGAYGFRICNDGAGSNRLVFSNYEDGTEWFWIDRDDGTINFLNTTNFYDVNVLDINITNNLTIGGYINGINISALNASSTYYSDED